MGKCVNREAGDSWLSPAATEPMVRTMLRLGVTRWDSVCPAETNRGENGMTENEPSGAERMFGDFAPGLVHFTDDVLFGEVWKRPQLSARDRSLVTVACLVAGGNVEQLSFHLPFAKENGASEEELIEAITHAAFYAGWPRAMSAMTVAKQVFADKEGSS
jgi:4-carboxymuconolactone decarboxylase